MSGHGSSPKSGVGSWLRSLPFGGLQQRKADEQDRPGTSSIIKPSQTSSKLQLSTIYSQGGVYLGSSSCLCCKAFRRLRDLNRHVFWSCLVWFALRTVFGMVSEVSGATGGAASINSNRFSFCLGLKGPSMTCDTDGSSSLTAVHLGGEAVLTKGHGVSNECLGQRGPN